MQEPGKEVAVVPPQGAVVSFNPQAQLAQGQEAAKALMQVVEKKQRKVVINGEQYLEFEDWQTLGRFFNVTVGTERTEPFLDEKQNIKGFLAVAVVYAPDGHVISRAEASCMRSEKKWTGRDEFQLRSMAQTRACAKALRNVLSWVVVLAGYKPTPAEELDAEVVSVKAPTTAPAYVVPEEVERISEAQMKMLTAMLRDKANLNLPADAAKVLTMVKSKYNVDVKFIEDIPAKVAKEMIMNLVNTK